MSKRWYVPLTRDLVESTGMLSTTVESMALDSWGSCYVSVTSEEAAERIIATLGY